MLRRFRDDEADDEASYGIMGRLAIGTRRAGHVQYSLLSCTAAGLGLPMVLRWIGCGWRALACTPALRHEGSGKATRSRRSCSGGHAAFLILKLDFSISRHT